MGGTSTVRTSYDSSAVASGPKSSSAGAGSQPIGGHRAPPRSEADVGRPGRGRPGGLHQAALQRGRPDGRAADGPVPLLQRLPGDLLLELEDALEQRLGAGRAAGDVDVDRDDLVDALRHGVRVPVRAAAVAARAEGDDVLRLGHLLVQALHGRGHLVRDRAGDDHQVGLARARREGDDAEADEVVAGHRRGDELDRAAGEAEVEDPEASSGGPSSGSPSSARGRGGRGRPAVSAPAAERAPWQRGRDRQGVTSMSGRPSCTRTAGPRPGSRGR